MSVRVIDGYTCGGGLKFNIICIIVVAVVAVGGSGGGFFRIVVLETAALLVRLMTIMMMLRGLVDIFELVSIGYPKIAPLHFSLDSYLARYELQQRID